VPYIDSRQDGGKFLYEPDSPSCATASSSSSGCATPACARAATRTCHPGAYQIQINEVPVVTGQATLGHILVNDTVERLIADERAGLRRDQPGDAASPRPGYPKGNKTGLEAAGLTTLGRLGLHHLAPGGGGCVRYAREFIGCARSADDARPAGEGVPRHGEGSGAEGGDGV